jgi:hypothetical protein
VETGQTTTRLCEKYWFTFSVDDNKLRMALGMLYFLEMLQTGEQIWYGKVLTV